MTKSEFTKAFKLAKSAATLSDSENELFYGFGLKDFKPIHCTIEGVAKIIRWQCEQFNGDWDMEALNEIAYFGKKRFIIIG